MKTATLTAELGQRRRYALSHEWTRMRDVTLHQKVVRNDSCEFVTVTILTKFGGGKDDYVTALPAASDAEAFSKLGHSIAS